MNIPKAFGNVWTTPGVRYMKRPLSHSYDFSGDVVISGHEGSYFVMSFYYA